MFMGTSIVVVDDVDLTDEQVQRLRALGTLVRHRDTSVNPSEIVARLVDAEVAILGWTTLNKKVLDQLNRLRMISVWATGYDYVDVDHARSKGIVVTNVPAYAAGSVAELTLGLMITLARHVVPADQSVRRGAFSWRDFRGVELSGRTLGLVGVGDIGAEVARLARAFGMRVVGHVRTATPERAARLGVEFVPLADLLRRSDFVSLHWPLAAPGTALLSAPELAAMKTGAYLLNTARAGLVDQAALVGALRSGHLAGAALDDIHFPDDTLTSLPNVVITPHIGFYTEESLVRKGDVCIGNVEAFLAGVPTNVV
jgi:phosphoglycerate dehydrogenase-like enzyme